MRSLNIYIYLLLLALLVVSNDLHARCKTELPVCELERNIRLQGMDMEVEFITNVEEKDLHYLIMSDGQEYFTDNAGSMLIRGDVILMQEDSLQHLNRKYRTKYNASLLGQFNEIDLIQYLPEGEVKSDVYVFTDVNCIFCKKLFSELDEILALGYRVNALLYTSEGEATESWQAHRQVYCSQDKAAALMAHKMEQTLPPATVQGCQPDMQLTLIEGLARKFQVNGTPAIIFPDGEKKDGYRATNYFSQKLQARIKTFN